MLTVCNSYVLWLQRCVHLRLVTVTFCDVNVVWCYVLSQYRFASLVHWTGGGGGILCIHLAMEFIPDILACDYMFFIFTYFIQHCFICRPSDSTVSVDATIEPRTFATLALTVRRSKHSATDISDTYLPKLVFYTKRILVLVCLKISSLRKL